MTSGFCPLGAQGGGQRLQDMGPGGDAARPAQGSLHPVGLVRPCVLPVGLLETVAAPCPPLAVPCKVPAAPLRRRGKKAKGQERLKADLGQERDACGKGGCSLTAASGGLSDGPFEVWMLIIGICLHREQWLKPL